MGVLVAAVDRPKRPIARSLVHTPETASSLEVQGFDDYPLPLSLLSGVQINRVIPQG